MYLCGQIVSRVREVEGFGGRFLPEVFGSLTNRICLSCCGTLVYVLASYVFLLFLL